MFVLFTMSISPHTDLLVSFLQLRHITVKYQNKLMTSTFRFDVNFPETLVREEERNNRKIGYQS